MAEPNWISDDLLRNLIAEARDAPRRRRNYNFHSDDAAPCQRLLNAAEPDSYIAPHRHLDPAKDETIVLLRGRMGLILFDEHGAVAAHAVLDSTGSRFGVTIAAGTFHTLVTLATGSVFFEAKAGPYRPLADEERAAWAPAEGSPTAVPYLATLSRLFTST
jgi:cupin fold WbuC family metalloprotein